MLEQMVMQAHSLGWSFDIAVVSLVWWALSLGSRIVAAFSTLIHPYVCRVRARRRDRPPISVIIPIKEPIPEAEAAFASVFSQTYPDFEVVISAAETASPMIEAARQVAARFPHIRSRFFTGNELFTINPKVSNLAPAIVGAHNDLVLIKDANILLEDGQLAELVRNLTSGVGLVCALPIAVAPVGFAAEIERTFINGFMAPLLLMGALFHRNVAFGKTMLFDRRDFNRAGGIEPLASTFGDDYVLGRMLGRIGLRTVYAENCVRQILDRRSFRQVWDRLLRWKVIWRIEEPYMNCIEILYCMAFTAVAGGVGAGLLGASWWLSAAMTLVANRVLEILIMTGRGWGWSWRFSVAALAMDILLPILWIRAWFVRDIQWGGVPIRLQPHVPRTL